MRRKKSRNFFGLFKRHPKPKRGRPAPRKYKQFRKKAIRSKAAKKTERKFQQFWGIRYAPNVISEPGLKKNVWLAGMGNSPGVFLADAPEGRETKRWKVPGRYLAATNASGNRIYLLRRRGLKKFGQKPKFVGYAFKTDYVPTGAIEKAGSHKSNRRWTHSHGRDERGRWPKVYRDAGGNYIYGPGTYRVTDWIRH